MIHYIRHLFFLILIVSGLAALSTLDNWIWREAHPGAPAWTYWFSR
jgi:hypothetical protein